MNRIASGVLMLGFATLLAVACGGESSSEESGESHFLAFCESTCAPGFDCVCGACTARCSSADECAEHASGAVCVPPSCGQGEPVCEVVCESNSDCSSLGGAYRCEGGTCRAGEPPAGNDGGAPPDGGNGGAGGGDCAAGCEKVRIYPEVPDQGCLDVYVEGFEVCACGELGLGRTCAKVEPDGSLFRVPAGVEFPDAEFSECSEEEAERVLHACEFEQCDVPPPSACSVEDTCEQFGCGGLEFDEEGCRRTECTSDEECSEDERCVTTSVTTNFCDYSNDGEACNCAGPAVDMTGSRCNPVSEVGPRGEWQKLEFVTVAHEGCSEDCVTMWTLIPDGTVEKAVGDSVETGIIVDQRELTEEELEEVNQLIDGPELRPGLRDGFPCGALPDASVALDLYLPDVMLGRDVNSCLDIDGHVVQQLGAIVMQE